MLSHPHLTLITARISTALLALGLTVSWQPQLTHAQGRDMSQVQIKATPVTGGIYLFEGAGGNIGVSAGEDGTLMIDDQFAPLAEKIEASLQALGKGPLKFVLNTHWHGDHTGGNPHFGRKATLVAHTNVRKRLADKTETPREALPLVTYDQGVSLHFNGEEIRVMALGPGHTDGDSVVFFTKSHVVHMGDQFFNGKFPFIDLGSGGDVAGYIQNVEKILELTPDDAKIIPGHGPLATKSDLKAFREMLVETTAIIRKGIADGKTAGQLKAVGFPAKWKEWGTGFVNADRWIDTAYNSLNKK